MAHSPRGAALRAPGPLNADAPLPDAMPQDSITPTTPHSAARHPPGRLQAHWMAELVRLRETHWGPLEDAQATRQARLGAADLRGRILLRALLLARRENLAALVQGWRRSALAILAALGLAAVLSGIGIALGALGNGSRPVNALWAAGALLGLHGLTFLLWIASFLLRPAAATGLGRFWLWATRKLARGPDHALVPQAFLNLLARAGALRWVLGAVSHGLWLCGLTAALCTLLVVLSTASYRFIWATTLLSPDSFVRITRTIGWLPAQLGFPLPSAEVVRASDGLQALPPEAQVQWSIWLIGALAVYGIAPRLLAFLGCAVAAARALRRLEIDPALPGFSTLRDRLDPAVQSTGIDRPADPLHEPRLRPLARADLAGGPVLAGLELPPDLDWPPAALPAGVTLAGRLDTREERNALLDALAATPPARLLLACDARQTPDRGALALVADLAAHAGQTGIWLLPGDDADAGGDTRAPLWRERLAALGLAPEAVFGAGAPALRWLERGHG